MKVVRSLPPLVEMLDEINAWFETDLGRKLLEAERLVVDPLMPRVFGYHLLQVGMHAGFEFCDQANVGHKFTMLPRLDKARAAEGVVGSAEELPFASDCIDAVLLHHTLDFAQSPHQVLREAARVLRPGGKLVIISFNPASLWGAFRRLPGRREQLPWRGHFIGQRRLHDWLALLGLRDEVVRSGFYRPPLKNLRWMERLRFLERTGDRYRSPYGGFLVTLACKEALAAIPAGMNWRRKLAMPMSEVALPRSAKTQSRVGQRQDNVVVFRQK